VTVLQRFAQRKDLQQTKVVYHLVADGLSPQLRVWQAPRQLHWTLRMLCTASVQAGYPTLVQINSMDYPLQIWQARSLLPSECALVVQHQGEPPWSGPRHLIQRWGMRAVDGFLFASHAASQPWLAQQIIPSENLVYMTADGSSKQREGTGKKLVQIYEEILQKRGK